jgi:hypothetical protein
VTSNLRYTCENPDCRTAGTRYDIKPGSEAACPTCGWMLYGHESGTDSNLAPT